MSEHTQLPWSVCCEGRCTCLMIMCAVHPIAKVESGEWGDTYPAMRMAGSSIEGRYEAYIEKITYGEIPQEIAKANALYIVKACNAFPDLVKALETASLMIKGQMIECAVIDTETMEPLGGMLDRVLRAVKDVRQPTSAVSEDGHD